MKFKKNSTTKMRSQICGLDVIFAPIVDVQMNLFGFHGLVEALVKH